MKGRYRERLLLDRGVRRERVAVERHLVRVGARARVRARVKVGVMVRSSRPASPG